jgi:lambda family phage portal protein
MNALDRFIAYFSPQRAVKRQIARKALQISNEGYGEGGASTKKKSMRAWRARPGSPIQDIDEHLDVLRGRSRDLYMNGPIATSAINTVTTNVIGPGLRLKARIDAEFLGLTEDEADQWERNVEREFALWAESKFCDAIQMSDFYDMQATAFMGVLMNGDSFCLFKRAKRTNFMPYSLRLHLIEADRVATPQLGFIQGKNQQNGNPIISGVEIDKDTGTTVAYWITNEHPGTFTSNRKWVRVEAFGELTGRPNILHLYRLERAEQRRGVPYLAPVIETLKQLTRYTEAELMASVISGMFTVFIRTEARSDETALGSMIPIEQQVAPKEEVVYEMAPGAINVLQPGESVEIANPGRPNSQFDAFVNALTRYIGAALEIPQEILLKSFNASYSASRAALLEAWKAFRTRRQWMAKEFCQPIYEEWLAEAVATGRIHAPGFFSDPVIRRAWSQAEWNGPAPGQIDPLKEVQAAGKRIELGLSTRERETIELTGGDFDRNIKQLKREQALMPGSPDATMSSKGGESNGSSSK